MSKDKKTTAPEKQEDKKEEPAVPDTEKEINSEAINSEDMKPEKQADSKEAGAAKPEKEQKAEKPAAADELSILNDKYLRICADYDNFRKPTSVFPLLAKLHGGRSAYFRSLHSRASRRT